MGFLKNIGKSLKGASKMLSLNNAVKVATGQSAGLVKELASRTITPLVSSGSATKVINSNQVQIADSYVQAQSNSLSNNLIKQVSANGTAQGVSSFFTKVYLTSMWTKYKTVIVISVLGVASFITYTVWFRKKTSRRRGR